MRVFVEPPYVLPTLGPDGTVRLVGGVVGGLGEDRLVEAVDLAADPAKAEVLAQMRERLDAWMRETDDPLLDGPVAPAPGTEYNTADQRSPSDPTTRA